MKLDYAGDTTLSQYLESSKVDLHLYYETHYAGQHSPLQAHKPCLPLTAPPAPMRSPQKDFTAHFKRKMKAVVDELEEYFKLDPEDFDLCNLIHWWLGHHAQFPNLFWLARDIISIPGSAIAVERVFSGGRDTISLRRASLHPETIQILMLMKKKLHLTRAQLAHHST